MNDNEMELFSLVEDANYQSLIKLLQSEPQLVQTRHSLGYSLLHTVAEKAFPEIVKKLFQMGADIHVTDTEGETPLWWAIDGANFSVADFLLDIGADLEIVNNEGHLPIHNTAKYGDIATLDYLISHGVPVDQRTTYGATALHIAATHRDMIDYLISKGAEVNAYDDRGWTPLHYALSANIVYIDRKLKCAECLIHHGANINLRTKTGETAWTMARRYQTDKYITLLKKYGDEL